MAIPDFFKDGSAPEQLDGELRSTLADYVRLYHDAAVAINQARITALVASESLKDYPRNLPPAAGAALSDSMQAFRRALEAIVDDSSSNAGGATQELKRVTAAGTRPHPVGFSGTMLFMHQGLRGDSTYTTDFSNAVFSQELVMSLAHLDAFLGDSVRLMCRVQPSLLKRKKQVTWEQVLDAGGWETLLKRLTDEFAFEFGWKGLGERVKHLREEHGLALAIHQDDLDLLDSAAQIRHVVVHNGSRVSYEYLRRTRRDDVRVGDPLVVDSEYAGRVSITAVFVMGGVLDAVAEKYFGVPAGGITGVERRGQPSEQE